MAERALRGSRLGAQSYETDLGVEMAPRQSVTYDCPRDHRFTIPFSLEADVPDVWECTVCGAEALRVDGTRPEPKAGKPARTHWDMLLERRSVKDLEVLLAERLELLRAAPDEQVVRPEPAQERLSPPDCRIDRRQPRNVPVAPLPPGGAAGTSAVRGSLRTLRPATSRGDRSRHHGWVPRDEGSARPTAGSRSAGRWRRWPGGRRTTPASGAPGVGSPAG